MKCLADQNLNRAIELQTMFTLTQLPKSSLFKPILEMYVKMSRVVVFFPFISLMRAVSLDLLSCHVSDRTG